MDIGKLIEVLRATLEPSQREQAEQQLTEVHKLICFTPTILQVVMSKEVDMPVRQAGVIYLKNMTTQYWEELETTNPSEPLPFFIHENDKQVIRDNIIEAVIHAEDPIRVQLTACISNIVKHDYPGKWPGIAEKTNMYLQSDSADTWHGALLCLYQLIKNFEYKKPEERGMLNQAMQVLLPVIHQRCMQLLPEQAEQSLIVQKQILKCFFALTQYFLPLDLITKETFTQWMELVRQIVDRPIPDVCDQIDDDDKPDCIWWKTKKWALHILARTFERYGSPGNVSKEYKAFSEWYLKSFSAGILQVLLKLLAQKQKGMYVSPRVLQQTLNFLNQGVSHAVSWKIMKPHMLGLIQEIIFPLMCHSDEDDELWNSDPVEYIRIKYDVFEEFFSPVTAAQSLLHSSVSKRKEVLQKTMGFILQTMATNDPRQRAGIMHMLGSVADILMTKKIYKQQIELMLVNNVYPVFGNEHGYLRARACWVLHCFCEVNFKNPKNLATAIELVKEALCTDKELPVRVEAAITLQMILTEQEAAQAILKPHINTVILELLKVIRETENDDLTSVMQKLVCAFPEEITPLAVDITTHLAETFAKVLESGTDGSDEKAIAAMGILNTLDTIVTVMENEKEILQHIEGIVLDVVGLIFNQGLIDFYEEILSLIYSLTCQQVTERLWNVYPMIYQMFLKDGFDYFTDMMPALHNYVTVDTATFMANPKNLEMVYEMCKTVMTGDAGEDAECHAAKLLEVILLQYKSNIDTAMQSFVELALERLTREVRTSELRTMCLQVVIAALYCNPNHLLETLSKMNMPNSNEPILGQFLKQWLHDTDCFLGLHDRKMCVLGLCCLMAQPNTNRPTEIQQVAKQILPASLLLFSGLQRAYAGRAAEDDDDEDSDEEYEEDPLEDEDDDIDDAGQEYLEKLEKSANGEDSDSDDDYDDDETEETALESYHTPLDAEECSVDEYQIFKQLLVTLETSDALWFQELTGGLTEEQRKELQKVFQLAEQRHAAQESKRIEASGGYMFTQTVVPTAFNFGGGQ